MNADCALITFILTTFVMSNYTNTPLSSILVLAHIFVVSSTPSTLRPAKWNHPDTQRSSNIESIRDNVNSMNISIFLS